MSKTKFATPAADPQNGQGGSYSVGPDGVRRLVERTAPAVPRSAALTDTDAGIPASAPQPKPEA